MGFSPWVSGESMKKDKKYIRIVKKNKKSIRVELLDGTLKCIPIDSFSEWSIIQEAPIKKNRKKKKDIEGKNGKLIKRKSKMKKDSMIESVDVKVEDKKQESVKTENIDATSILKFSYNKHITRTIVGIDPSYTRTGIVVLTKDKHIVFHTLSEHIGKKDFIHTYNSAYLLATKLKEYLSQFEPYDVVMEYAPPVSSMSPALYCLDALYHFVLHDDIKQLYHPMTLATIVGKRDRTKADSVLLGLSIIEELKTQGWVVDQKRKPCHDCMEALIYVDYYLRNRIGKKDG